MQKKFLTFLMLANVCASSYLMSATSFQMSTKDHSYSHVLRDHGKLFFHFTTFLYAQDVLSDVTGHWQVFILTPDQKKVKGPKINVSKPPANFEILIDPPILFGNYTIVIENISAKYRNGDDFIGSFIEPNVVVTNTFNSKVAITNISSAALQTFIPAKNPVGNSVQGIFVPPLNFVH